MDTKIFSANEINEAADLLRNGELIAFPTETVYGLGAVAHNEAAVKNVYQVKGRPSDNPLIVHVASTNIAKFVKVIPDAAPILMDAFWPGPLTLIFEAKEGVFAPVVSAGRPTVSLRMPDQPLTLQLIEAAGFPLVGPSANTSGKPSPTAAKHVYHDMNGKIAGIVDGGETNIGVESTVLDLTDPRGPIILRPGAITQDMLEEVLGQKVWLGGEMPAGSEDEIPKAPGMKYTHYSPQQPVILMKGSVSDWQKKLSELQQAGKAVGVLASEEMLAHLENENTENYSLGKKAIPAEASRKLYAGLRHFDEREVDVILAEAYEEIGIGAALMNRLEKAASAVYPE